MKFLLEKNEIYVAKKLRKAMLLKEYFTIVKPGMVSQSNKLKA